MVDCLTARYDAMLEARLAKDRLAELLGQWMELHEEAKEANITRWFDFQFGNDVGRPCWASVLAEWEKNNPGWTVVNNGLRKKKD